MTKRKLSINYTAQGNGRYRILGRNITPDGSGFVADVHMYLKDGAWVCIVDSCNNPQINAQDIAMWCERNIQ